MSAPTLSTPITAIYTGRVQLMPGDSRTTGIFKHAVTGPLQVGVEGLEGDQQADRRVHGGPEKALHHFPVANYRRLADRFPDLAAAFVPGALGENITTPDLDEGDVFIGDTFAFGSARIQLSQPRRPCWKIDARFGLEGIALFIEAHGLAGWYYRVLEPGTVRSGDELKLLDRHPESLSLREFHVLAHAHRPTVAELMRLAHLAGLEPSWAERFRARALWLHHNAPADGARTNET
ncbi:MOSC domain-containing protein YiiM [Panacagrimonas perspica]|uniref:MOSC domain-containing protein YiiM n=1 Tax=Panacagrimonas perspica TaxID=381431 RepID=A0A4R7P6L1_9GAMM|nr:MOSC domain-containing protein [Panacagrimonas perspica]TDU28680.1 MOSC domain-containing protein YiiM [Panacagrimonas perspica]THD05006.1 hypothetical protein B1810_03420 [Panacagrimonas perspica]